MRVPVWCGWFFGGTACVVSVCVGGAEMCGESACVGVACVEGLHVWRACMCGGVEWAGGLLGGGRTICADEASVCVDLADGL